MYKYKYLKTLLLLGVSSLVILLSGCSNKGNVDNQNENQDIPKLYAEGLEELKQKNYSQAAFKLFLPDQNNYKDSKVLRTFALTNPEKSTFTTKKYDELKRIPDDYKGDLAQEVLEARKKYFDNVALIYNDCINYIISGKIKKLENGNFDVNDTLFELKQINYKDSETLYLYVSALQANSNKDKAMYLSQIKNFYQGDLANEFDKYQELYRKDIVTYIDEKIRTKTSSVKTGNPPIGSSKDEALSFVLWKYPSHINKTITSFGVSEQYVYSGYRYLYFENDKLTAIQE